MSTIYKINNKVNGMYYIGSSIEYGKRKRSHLNSLRQGNHSNRNLQEDFNKYGEESFVFEVLEEKEGENREELFELEQSYIDKSNKEMLYNLYLNAYGMSYYGPDNHMYGKTHTPEIRSKLSEINSGENNPWFGNSQHMEAMRSKITKRFDGRKHSAETKQKMSESHQGRVKSESERQKLSENNGNNSQIKIEGVVYRSMSQASRELGISRTTITSRVNNPKFTNYTRCSEGVETNSKPEISAG